jgi:hypothetical protein
MFGHVAAQFVAKLVGVVGVDLGVAAATREGDVGQSRVDELLVGVLGIHMNQDSVGGGALTAVAGDSIAVVEMRMVAEVQIDLAPGVETDL